jgi:hypothetical protein
MLNTFNPMNDVIAHLRNHKIIDAIKEFRAIYGVGLKEAKDAVEAIAAAMGVRTANGWVEKPTDAGEYMVVSRRHETDWDYCASHCDSRADADGLAADECLVAAETYVVKVVAKSVTTRSMKEVA